MWLRRAGKKEIAWEEFLEKQRTLPFMTKLNKYRKLQAKYLYRKAGIQFGAGNIFAFAGDVFGALLLQLVTQLTNSLIRELVGIDLVSNLNKKRCLQSIWTHISIQSVCLCKIYLIH